MDKLRRALTFFVAAALAITCYLGMCATAEAADGSLSFDDLLNVSRSPTEITVSADKSVVAPGEEITVTVSVTGGERIYTTFAYVPVWDNAGFEVIDAEIVGVGLDASTSAVQMDNRVYVMYDTAQARTGEMFRFTVKIKEDAVLGEYPVTVAILVAKKSISFDYILHDLTLSIREATSDECEHVLGDWVVETEPTCTEDGEKRKYCDYCVYYESGIIEATGHDHKPVVTDPTCTERGYTTHTCHCGDSYVDSYVNALDHIFGDYIYDNNATCTVDGTKTAVCDLCGKTDSKIVEGSATGHNHKSLVTDPTCTERGYTTHTCACGDSYKDTYVNALGHSFAEWIVNEKATCTVAGEKQRNCTRCDHFETEVVAATGHSYKATVTKPTCVAKGYTTYTCACGDSYVDSYVNALDHIFGDYIYDNNATCTVDGTKTAVCDLCGKTDSEIVEGSATGHNHKSLVTDPTCMEKGYTTYTCACGDSYKDTYVNALGHSFTKYISNKDATYEADGTETATCDRCTATDKRTAVGSKLQKNGWIGEGGKWYYYKENVKQTGWLQSGKIWYYLDKNGVMVTGTVILGGQLNTFDTSGVWKGYATGWQKVEGKWYYGGTNGKLTTGWKSLGGTYYYFNASGAMQTGWQLLGGTYYYFNNSGAMLTGWQLLGGTYYYFKSSGAMVTGTAIADGALCKFDASGAWKGYLNGWQKVDGKWYYGGTNGKLTTGWKAISGTYYYFSTAGVMQTGWVKDGGVYYYMNSSGAMVTGWLKLGGVYYYMNSSGAMVTGWVKDGGVYYYMNSSGAMVTGWLKVDGVWYYFRSSGAMVTGSLNIGGKVYNFNSSGACLNP